MSYFRSKRFSVISGCAAWAIGFPALNIFFKFDPVNSIVLIAIFNILQASFIMCADSIRKDNEILSSEVCREEGIRLKAQKELEDVARFEKGIKDKELNIFNLYEVTKKMSEDLRFEDIFRVFSTFLKQNFIFDKCDLLILKWEKESPSVDRIYSTRRLEASGHPAVEPSAYEKLIKKFIENQQEVYELRANDEKNSFAGVPLLSEKKLVGILTVEGLPKEDFEKFVILSIQFALEIRKVLLYETVEKLAITDSLTGLYLRRYFSERFGEELQRSERYKFKFSFLMIDIDNFKRCNDTYGHLVGDVILKEIARLIKENVREIDIISRYGGEEFAVILPETDSAGAALASERLRKKIEENVFKAYDERLKITVSIGFAVYPEDANNAKALIERSDSALYAAKKSGKNVVCEYKKEYNS